MRKTKFARKYDAYKPSKGEKLDKVSKTIQGETYSIRELLKNHTKGLDMTIGRNPIWGDDPDHDSLDLNRVVHLDLAEQQEHLDDVKNWVQDTESQLKKRKADLAAEQKAKAKETKEEEKTETKKNKTEEGSEANDD